VCVNVAGEPLANLALVQGDIRWGPGVVVAPGCLSMLQITLRASDNINLSVLMPLLSTRAAGLCLICRIIVLPLCLTGPPVCMPVDSGFLPDNFLTCIALFQVCGKCWSLINWCQCHFSRQATLCCLTNPQWESLH